MKIKVLGSAAGGGFPQWNCNCSNCAGIRSGTIKAKSRTQSSIAVSENGVDWLLINASPDILAQIRATPELQPARAQRDTGIVAVVLMDAQIDHVTGLLMLREHRQELPLYATASVLNDISTGFPLIRILSHYCGIEPRSLPLNGSAITIPGLQNVSVTAVPLHSKAPPYSPHRHFPQLGDNIGLLIEHNLTGNSLFYAPGLGEIDDALAEVMGSANVLLVDGTFWSEDEMVALGLSSKYAGDMGHLPQSGDGGMLDCLNALEPSLYGWRKAGQEAIAGSGRVSDLGNHSRQAGKAKQRKILIHINNTNPILRDDSPQRAILDQQGVEVAFDGMEIIL